MKIRRCLTKLEEQEGMPEYLAFSAEQISKVQQAWSDTQNRLSRSYRSTVASSSIVLSIVVVLSIVEVLLLPASQFSDTFRELQCLSLT